MKIPAMDYEEMLKLPAWKRKRAEVIARDNDICSVCGSHEKPLQVHHIRYGNESEPWSADDADLVCLCAECHEKFHKCVKWLQAEIVDVPPSQLIGALHGNAHHMADLIAEISGRLASLSWCVVKEIPLK